MTKQTIIPALALAITAFAVPAQSPVEEDKSTQKIDRSLITGVWLAHPFDGPGTKPRMEFKKNGKMRMLMQDDAEMDAKWEWKEPATIVLTFPKRDRTIESKVSRLTKDQMTMVSSRGRETNYVKLKSWSSKDP